MTFVSTQQVRFAHVDPAGIVFYPRYFEMLNAAVEDYFESAIGVSFAEMHRGQGLGVPTVKLEVDFKAPSRLGDRLAFELEVVEVGRSSAQLVCTVRGEDASERLIARVVLVCMDLAAARAVPWPEALRPPVDRAVPAA